MRWWLKALIGFVVFILLLVVLIPSAGYLLLRRSFPVADGTLKVPGLEGRVEVYRDRWGVPHIYAQNEADLLFAQGYVTAQDRLWQMEFSRRIGSGTLSEIFGDGTVEMDKFIRTIGWRRAAEEEVVRMDAETRELVEAYAAGVNAFIDSHKGSLPPEFTVLGFSPAPWTPADGMAWGKVMAWNLGGNWDAELLRSRLIAKLGQKKAGEVALPYPSQGPLILPAEALVKAALERARALEAILGRSTLGLGSNNWVVDGSKSATGKPLLCDDMHLGIQMPSIWYEVHLIGGDLDVEGYSFPGVPGVIVGHNQRIGWGVTNAGPDVQDLYMERVNPSNPDQYEYKGEWVDMEILEERIEVKGQEPVVEQVRLTRHGPIITPVLEGVTETLALRWTASEPGEIFKSVILLDKAQNWNDFRVALKYWAAPSQNFVYADTEGNIGYQMPGLIPIRAKGQGITPVPGWTGEYEWEGYIPFEELPSVLNPPTHYVVTANNKVIGDAYPYFIAYDWDIGHRAQRIKDLIEAKGTLTIDDMKAIHGDTYSIAAETFVPYLLALPPQGFLEERALNELKNWDLREETNSTGAAIYEVFYLMLVKNTFADELGEELFADYLNAWTWHHLALESMIAQEDNPWFDNANTPQRESRHDILRQSFDDALELLGSKYGDVPNEWTWGRLHTVTFGHTLGVVKPLDLVFNRGPIAARGGGSTVDAASYDYSLLAADLPPAEAQKIFAVISGVSQRMILDFSDFSRSLSIHTTGQVGIPFHKHYADMISLWQNVEYHPMLWDREYIEGNREGLLILEP